MAHAVFLFVGTALLISGAYAQGANNTSVVVSSSMVIHPTSQVVLTSTQVANKTATTVVTTPSVTPTATSPAIHPTTPAPTPKNTTSVIPTTQPRNTTTKSTIPTTNPTTNPTTPGACPTCKSCPKGAHGKWVAVAFAILFGITTVVMTVLYCRQRKIYRDLEGDSSLSRLI